jgi:hypothetical protein
MSSRALGILPVLLASALAPAQVQDVGLRFDAGMLTVILGQDCGPVTCSPLQVGGLLRGSTRILTHFSAPQTPYLLGVSVPGPCVVVPGIANVLLLGPGLEVLAFGLTSSPPFVPTACDQGIDIFAVNVPATLPQGLQVRFQSLGMSVSGVPAFGPALELVVQ